MKIVYASNYNDEMMSESLVAENVTHDVHLGIMVQALNASIPHDSRGYFKAVPDEYKLYKFEP